MTYNPDFPHNYLTAIYQDVTVNTPLVTEEMLAAGNRAYHRNFGNGRPCLEVYGHVYRAMAAVAPKVAERRCEHVFPPPGPYDPVLWCSKCHRTKYRGTGRFVSVDPEASPNPYHNRKTDR